MVSAIVASVRALRDHILQTRSRTIAFVKGQGTPGQRFAPKQAGNNDAKIGSRLDHGDVLTKHGKQYRRYKFQLNKDAENVTIKQEAGKNSHKVWAQVDVEMKENANQQEAKGDVEAAFEEIEQQL